MPDLEQIYKDLLVLPRREYSDLLQKVELDRRRAFERAEAENPLKPGMSRDDFARWIARSHYYIDKGIARIFHLPKGAPDREVRLLEVNVLAAIPELAPIEAVDYRPDIEGIDFAVFVAEVTPDQMYAIATTFDPNDILELNKRGDLKRAFGPNHTYELVQKVDLPHGWCWDGWQEISPPID